LKLTNQLSAVITGGASGLGAATARALAAAGVRVGIFDLDRDRGAALAQEIDGVFALVDVTSDTEVDAGFGLLRAALGQERILVNCAGTGAAIKTASRDKRDGSIKSYPLDVFERTINVNLNGTFRCLSRSAAGMMTLAPIEGERGVIINTASIAAQDGQVGQAAYSASKAAIVGMTLPVARDLAQELIRVNTILPGIFDTPMLHSAPDNVKAALALQVPNPSRLGKPEEYSSLVLEICRNGYINAESIRLDGALRMAPR